MATEENLLSDIRDRQFPNRSLVIDSTSSVPSGNYNGIVVLQTLTVNSITLAGPTEDLSSGIAGLLGDVSPGPVIMPLYFTDIDLGGGSAIIF